MITKISVLCERGKKRAVCSKYNLAAESVLHSCSLEVNCNFYYFNYYINNFLRHALKKLGNTSLFERFVKVAFGKVKNQKVKLRTII